MPKEISKRNQYLRAYEKRVVPINPQHFALCSFCDNPALMVSDNKCYGIRLCEGHVNALPRTALN